jgi:class 3 adenylate cyclase
VAKEEEAKPDKEGKPNKEKRKHSLKWGDWVTVPSTSVVYSTAGEGGWITKPIPIDTEHYAPLTTYRGERQQALEREIAELKRRWEDQQREYLEEAQRKGATEETLRTKLQELERTNSDLSTRLTLSFVLNRIHERAKSAFLASREFQERFLSKQECAAFIMAVDLRRSTDLMLKARTPEGFAQFITTLCSKLRGIILDEHGVFDKFTGDGILCFFPDFYTGEQAGYHAVAAADRCHRVFEQHYREHRASFQGVLIDVGLGIGIDFGTTHLVPVAAELAIVGEPVVYACRMAGARAGTTLLNQPAYEQILNRFSEYFAFEETTIDVKHEGSYLAYSVRRNEREHGDNDPAWVRYVAKEQPPAEQDGVQG